MKNKLKAVVQPEYISLERPTVRRWNTPPRSVTVNTITNEKRGLSQPKADRTVQEAEKYRDENEAKQGEDWGHEWLGEPSLYDAKHPHRRTPQGQVWAWQVRGTYSHAQQRSTLKHWVAARAWESHAAKGVSMFHVHRDSYTAVSNNTRPTPRTRVGALSRCHPGHRDTPVGPGRTPTVHRCPRGEAVGGPSTNTTHVVRRSTELITRMWTFFFKKFFQVFLVFFWFFWKVYFR